MSFGDREKGKKLDSGVKPVTKLENYGTYNFHQDEDGFVYVYTDGSCEGNGTAAGRAGMEAAALAIRLAKQQGIKD
ncbi:ribonuclease H1 [Culex quinquefasciatus]|uniref:Ribonuclease H1 n=1 Tax=Culex quinquefasciatus TaxID=7176 RepID=B0WYX8_CULQU|nr:ribonuclease H1 [Culex quinquefasciatus]|eukprot:XP_001862600.1 ribonuclease H1 [Culex quinquefasciatus]